MVVSNVLIIILLVMILLLVFLIYLGIGFIVCLGVHNEVEHPDRRTKFETILFWPKLMIEFLRHVPKQNQSI